MHRVGWVETAPSSKPNSTVAWKTAQPFPLGLHSEARPHPSPLPQGEGAFRAGVELHQPRYPNASNRCRLRSNQSLRASATTLVRFGNPPW